MTTLRERAVALTVALGITEASASLGECASWWPEEAADLIAICLSEAFAEGEKAGDEKRSKCVSCGEPLSSDCPKCKRLWES
jgi:hypothetical protein